MSKILKDSNVKSNEPYAVYIIIAILSVLFYITLIKDYGYIPKQLKSNLKFEPVVAGLQTNISEPNNYSLSPDGSSLSYNQKYAGAQLTITQRSIPDEIKDFPERYDKLIDVLNPQKSLVINDNVYYLSYDGQKQQAITMTDNMLIVISSNHELSDNMWQNFIQSLKPQN